MINDDKNLIESAIKARERSYCPYSGFSVGAALLSSSGKVYTGCNIENSAFSPTICAERVAFFKAVEEGERDFVKIAVVGGKKGEPVKEETSPCGVCRQVMAEFCKGDFQILTFDGEDIRRYSLSDLLPASFGLKK